MAADQCVPSRSRSEDLSEPLGEDGQGPGWNMAVFLGSDHPLDGFNLA